MVLNWVYKASYTPSLEALCSSRTEGAPEKSSAHALNLALTVSFHQVAQLTLEHLYLGLCR
jgi:hypothetical protein